MAHAPALPREMLLADYEALVETGALEDVKVELIDGQVVAMSPQGEAHSEVIVALTRLLAHASDDLRVQMPVAMAPASMPEPDLALTRRSPFGTGHPRAAALVIEVVVTARREAMRKVPVYAAGGAEECWIVDVPNRRVDVHDRPTSGRYARTRTFAGGDVLTAPGTDIRFPAADVFARLDE